jgi:hypothetical protein
MVLPAAVIWPTPTRSGAPAKSSPPVKYAYKSNGIHEVEAEREITRRRFIWAEAKINGIR